MRREHVDHALRDARRVARVGANELLEQRGSRIWRDDRLRVSDGCGQGQGNQQPASRLLTQAFKPCGPAHQVIRWIPPLNVTSEQVNDALGIFGENGKHWELLIKLLLVPDAKCHAGT